MSVPPCPWGIVATCHMSAALAPAVTSSLHTSFFPVPQIDLYAGALFVHICLGWNFYLSTILMLIITALYTIAGTCPAGGGLARGAAPQPAHPCGWADACQSLRGWRGSGGRLLNGPAQCGWEAGSAGPADGPHSSAAHERAGDTSAGKQSLPPASLFLPTGGLAAVIYTDALQTLIMVVGAIILTVKGEAVWGLACPDPGASTGWGWTPKDKPPGSQYPRMVFPG